MKKLSYIMFVFITSINLTSCTEDSLEDTESLYALQQAADEDDEEVLDERDDD